MERVAAEEDLGLRIGNERQIAQEDRGCEKKQKSAASGAPRRSPESPKPATLVPRSSATTPSRHPRSRCFEGQAVKKRPHWPGPQIEQRAWCPGEAVSIAPIGPSQAGAHELD